MAPDIRFVPDAPQGHPHVLAAHGLGDGPGDGGLAHPGGTHQAEDLALDLGGEFPHRQGFQHPLLHLLEAVVLPVQQPPGLVDVDLVPGIDVPGQVQDGVQVDPEHRAFLGTAGHPAQPLQFLEEFGLRFRRQLEGEYPGPVVVQFLVAVLALPQFLRDDLHLLPEIILPLVFVHLLPHPLLDALLQVEYLVLLLQQADDHLQAAGDAGFLQDALLDVIIDVDVGGDVLRKVEGVGGIHHAEHQFLGHLGGQVAVVPEQVLGRPHQGVALGPVGHPGPGGVVHHQPGQEGLLLGDGHQLGPVLALHQHPQRLRLDPDDLADLRHHPHLVQLGLVRVVVLEVPLGHQEYLAAAADGLVQGHHRLFPPHVEVEYHVGEQNQPPQGQHRHLLRHLPLGPGGDLLFCFLVFVHGYDHLSGPIFRVIVNRPDISPVHRSPWAGSICGCDTP